MLILKSKALDIKNTVVALSNYYSFIHLSINSVLVTLLVDFSIVVVLKTLCSKTKQLRSVLVQLLLLNKFLNDQGLCVYLWGQKSNDILPPPVLGETAQICSKNGFIVNTE